MRFGVDDVNELASMISDRQGGERDAGDPTTERTSKAYLALKNDAVATDDTEPSRQRSSQLRLPKLVAMYASRACRSAIMIGTALKPQEMSRVVEKLENVEQPWNCPHGRPTLRHLVDLAPLREHRKRKMEAMQCT
jgi:DNA mismatch repair protein PMS2